MGEIQRYRYVLHTQHCYASDIEPCAAEMALHPDTEEGDIVLHADHLADKAAALNEKDGQRCGGCHFWKQYSDQEGKFPYGHCTEPNVLSMTDCDTDEDYFVTDDIFGCPNWKAACAGEG